MSQKHWGHGCSSTACSTGGLRVCGLCGEGADGTAGLWGSRSPALFSATINLQSCSHSALLNRQQSILGLNPDQVQLNPLPVGGWCQRVVWFAIASQVVMLKIIIGDSALLAVSEKEVLLVRMESCCWKEIALGLADDLA